MNAPHPILVADCIAKSFGDRRVLTAATLRAVPGQIRALLGRNGSGKTTLIEIAIGHRQPESGNVFVRGEALRPASLPKLARLGVMYLPDAGLLSLHLPLRRQLDFFAQRFPSAGIDPRAAAERLRVLDLWNARVGTFSGGERRRADLAAALVRRPACLIADEPYRGVAPLDADLFTSVFRELAGGGCAIIATGHEAPVLLDAADHVTWCTSGTTLELGPPREAQAHDRFRREYLGDRSR